MHTAVQLATSKFGVTIDGSPARFDDLLPDWRPHDRFGIVVDRPLGAVGASLLLQIAIAAFYEADRGRPGYVYPEVYAFHVGGPHGTLAWYDVFPPRKEVVVPDDAGAILDAINDRAITRLAVVDGPVERTRLHHQEPAAAAQRIVTAFAYDPSGRTRHADVELAAREARLAENTEIILHPETTTELQQELIGVLPRVKDEEDVVYPDSTVVPPAVREAISRRRAEISADGLPVETYRRVPVADALGMLHVRGAVVSTP
jgi:hypothetical protein